ncbi:hypothetical protein GX48_01935 [Paracoccidioides brasiliensis]|nr:hypothetical protein GX48_01935 [Paracoccidioides brasiliensis]
MQPRPTNVAMMFVEDISPRGHDFGTRTPGGNSSLQTAIPLDPAPVSAPLLKRPRLCHLPPLQMISQLYELGAFLHASRHEFSQRDNNPALHLNTPLLNKSLPRTSPSRDSYPIPLGNFNPSQCPPTPPPSPSPDSKLLSASSPFR